MIGPLGPYSLMKSALVGRPASTYRRVPSEMWARAELLRVTEVAVGLVVAEGAPGGSDLIAALVSFSGFGFIVTLLRFELLAAFFERFDFYVISSPPWNSRTIRVSREK
jgi:hypothetical protein